MKSLITALLCIAGCSALHAAPVTVVRQHFTYEVATDGTWTMEVDMARRADEAPAVNGLGQAPVQYSESLQTLEILEAYTITKDGKRIDVAPDKIITQQMPASTGAPTFSDVKLKMVVFPQMEVGATVNVRYRLKQLKPFLPDLFSAIVTFNPYFETQAGSVTLRAPEKLKLHISSRDVQGGEVKSATTGQREWHWTYASTSTVVPEEGSLIAEAFSPYVAASTMQTYPELGKAYMIGAEAAAKVTPAIQKLADDITMGIADKRAQADALYRWVSTEIRYVQIAMGVGGYVPHLANEVITAKYGDCKDKSTLLIALLHAKGIRAMPVLINTGAAFELPETVLLGAFNHAITYLPEWDLFVDATAGFAPFGVLTSSLLSKKALLGGDKSLPTVVKTMPAGNASRDRLVTRAVATLSADGTVTGTNRIEPNGSGGLALRGLMGAIPETMRPALAKSMLAETGQTGDATMTMSDGRDLTKPFWLSFELKLPGLVNVPGPGALSGSIGMALTSPIQSGASSMLKLDRKLDFACPEGAGIEESVELTLPAGFNITMLPKAADIESAFGRFTASYEVKDGKLLVTRKLDSTPPRAVCTAADSAELRKWATAISQQMRAQILYQ
jgi:transglutaminase-like putative cysteine protease